MENLIGLVICGGQSARMGRDKGLIEWHGTAQRYFLYKLLEPLCNQVYISSNASQAIGMEPGYKIISDNDKYDGIGPMAALLTAFENIPGNSFLMIGCDYPYLKCEDVLQLIGHRNENDSAASFYNATTGFYEPLLSIYEKKIAQTVFENYQQHQFSLQNILRSTTTCKVFPKDLKVIKSVDTPEQYLAALEELKSGSKYF